MLFNFSSCKKHKQVSEDTVPSIFTVTEKLLLLLLLSSFAPLFTASNQTIQIWSNAFTALIQQGCLYTFWFHRVETLYFIHSCPISETHNNVWCKTASRLIVIHVTRSWVSPLVMVCWASNASAAYRKQATRFKWDNGWTKFYLFGSPLAGFRASAVLPGVWHESE